MNERLLNAIAVLLLLFFLIGGTLASVILLTVALGKSGTDFAFSLIFVACAILFVASRVDFYFK